MVMLLFTQFFFYTILLFFNKTYYFPTENQEPQLQGKVEEPMDR